MTRRTLALRSLVYFWRTHAATTAGLATAVAVLTGALLVGESVRASLRSIVVGRLGTTDVVVSGASYFGEGLAGASVGTVVRAAVPIVVLEGAVVHEPSKRRAGRVTVYGVDDRFWSFQGRADLAPGPGPRDAWIGEALAAHLGAAPGDDLVLTVERAEAIPAGALQGRRDEPGRLIRVTIGRTLAASDLGQFSFAWQQATPRIVFVPISRLQRDLDRRGRVNALLAAFAPEAIDKSGVPTTAAHEALADRLREVYALGDIGLRVRLAGPGPMVAVESESGFLSPALAGEVEAVARRAGLAALPVLTYIANTIRLGPREIPYSTVSALDLSDYGRPAATARPPNARPATASGLPPLWLNAWAAADLAARPGDRVELDYFVWRDEDGLSTQSAAFELAGVVPLSGAGGDADLTPEYPGITGETSLADWDPPFPVDLSRVRDVDERYWDDYRTTPKAFVLPDDGRRLWSTRYGDATSFRFAFESGAADRHVDDLTRALREAIDPVAAGALVVRPVRRDGLEAARGTTDFGEYFLYFSAFLMASALLLAGLFFRLGVDQRSREIGLLRAVGFSPSLVRRLLLVEGTAIAALGTLFGTGLGVAYAWAIMHALSTWWIGAVGTTDLALSVSARPLAFGAAGGLVTSLVVLAWALGRLVTVSPRWLLANAPGADVRTATVAGARATARRMARAAVGLATVGLGLLAAALAEGIDPVAGFFGAGLAGLGAGLAAFRASLGRTSHVGPSRPWRAIAGLGVRSAEFRPGRAALAVALIAFATFVIVAVGAFRRDAGRNPADPTSGTGGFALMVETTLPVMHDPNSPGGREDISAIPPLIDLGDVRFWRLRLRPGEDGSCVNLYRPRNPRLLGVPPGLAEANRFSFSRSLAETPAERENPWTLLDRRFDDGSVPAIVDQTSLSYVLHMKLGDVFEIDRAPAPPIRLRLVAALADSMLQSELLIAEQAFLELFPNLDGARVLLVDAPFDRGAELSTGLEAWLDDYGAEAMSTTERLAGFHRVENTYLSTFQALGALGLLLGTVGVGLVLLRGVLEQRREIAVLRAVGYQPKHLAMLVVAESAFLTGWGLAAGAICAVVAIVPAVAERAQGLPVASLALLVTGVAAVALLSSFAAARVASRTPLISTLRTE
jgi:putative ABC transport system permease protein